MYARYVDWLVLHRSGVGVLVALALFLCAVMPNATAARAAPGPQTAATHLAAPHDPPHILAVSIAPTEFGSGDIVRGKVFTSSNVASVEARIGAFAARLARSRPGEFVFEYRVPWIPFFLHHAYDVEMTARNADGMATTQLVPIVVH